MMSEELKRDRKTVVSVAGVAGAAQERIARVLATILILLLGVGFIPASASAAPSSAVAPQSVAPSPTRLLGFNQAPATVRVGGQLADAVAVLPKAARTVYVQYRRAGTTRFTTSYSQRTSAQGSLTAYLMPPAAGTWQFRLVVVATTRAKALVSPSRTVKASGIAKITKILGFASTPATITVGAIVRDAVSVWPRASRTVEVQARRAGTATWVKTSMSGTSSAVGSFMAIYRPAPGVWQYRLMVRASTTARTAVSPPRTVTARPSPGIRPPGTPIPPDTTAPGPVTALIAGVASDSSITLNWANPNDLDFTGVTIRRLVGDVAPATATDGTAVTFPASATATSFTDTGLTALTLYSYALFAHDNAANYAAAVNVTGWTTATPPGPTAAVLSISRPSGVATTKLTVGARFDFDASRSYAGPGKTFSTATLDYGDSTPPETFTGDSWNWVRSHSYSTTGPRTVTLTVTDSAGVTVSDVLTVTVFDAPTAKLVSNGPAQVGAPVRFDLTLSTPAGTDFTSYDLNVIGADGTKSYGGNGSPPATKDLIFTSSGTYEVQFIVSNDAGGLSAVDSMTIDVAGATTTPVLSIGSSGIDTTTIPVGGTLLCVASDTYAGPGVTLASVVLDYGDNSALTVFNGNQAYWFEAHSYSSPGTYPVTLTVTDSANVTVTKVVTVTVAPVPTAAITIEGNPTSVHAGSPVTFTLASSTPPGTATQSWSMYGDWLDGGYGTTPPATVTHTFREPGTYTVQFNYSNDAMGTAESSMEVTVVP